MDTHLKQFIAALAKTQERAAPAEETAITVSETISAAATFYETVRNTLEYDEEHLLRRNAIRRIIKRRLAEENLESLASDLLRELIWARYLPNKKVPESMVGALAAVFAKYQPWLAGDEHYDWLLDVLSTEVEYVIEPPLADEALAAFTYNELRHRLNWASALVAEADRDLQLYMAVHRSVLKSNRATLRFRLLTLYYPEWATAAAADPVVKEIGKNLGQVVASVEGQINHPAADLMFRLVRKHAVVFQLLRDIAQDNPATFLAAVEKGDPDNIKAALAKAAGVRYDRFHARQQRGVVRAVAFLFLTKFILALIVELPYERLIIKNPNWIPLAVNVLFHPVLLGLISLSVSIPVKKNNEKIAAEALAILGLGEDFRVIFKVNRPWAKGALGVVFKVLYAALFVAIIGGLSYLLYAFKFNVVSIAFFLFFLSLVTFFGLKARNRQKELVIIEKGGGFLSALVDILFLPIIRVGRWIALHAPRINIALFFLDFIIEAPFKAAIRLVEGWLAFLREKREEI